MISRPKSRSAHIAQGTSVEEDAKDQLLCRLELEQTVSAEKIRKLEQTREQLAEYRKAFAFLYERSPIGYITLDKRGHIYDLNEMALQILGYDQPRLRHVLLTFVTHPDDQKKLLEHLSCCEKETRVVTALRLRQKTGEFVPCQLISVPFNVVNERQMYLTALVDMRERSRHEKALAETKDFAEAIVETVGHPLAVLDADLRIVSVNRAFTSFFKRPAQYIRGRVFEVMLNLWWSGNQLREELEKVLVKDRPLENYRLEVQLPDIGRRILLVSARRLHQKENLPHRLLVSMEDMTELEIAREALRKTNEELEQRVVARTKDLRRSYEQMESFCYSIAHDLRAPLRSMTGFSHLLEDQFGEQMTQQGRDYARRIQQSSSRMDQLIRDLLSYGRLNTAALDTTSIDLEKIYQEVLLQHEKDIHEKGAKIKKAGRLPVVLGHHAICQAILANLLTNALKFVAPGVRPWVEIFGETRGEWERVWVADNGIGIAKENQGKIFGVFQRLHSTDSYPGTGIGLAIVAKGIERMGGRMGLESAPGKGSRFWFELPRQKVRGVG